MNIILVLSAIFVLIAGILRTGGTSSPHGVTSPSAVPTSPVKAETPSPRPSASSTPDEIKEKESSKTGNGWIYPDSTMESQGEKVVLVSPDGPGAITDWYKNKVDAGGYTTRNFIATSANEEVKNVIQAVNSGSSVNVEISRGKGDGLTRIEVEAN